MYHDEETGITFVTRRDARLYKARQMHQLVEQGDLRSIEGFRRYTVLQDGVVMNLDRGMPVKPFFNGHRLAITLVADAGGRKTFSLSRLVAEHFIPKPDDDQYYDVVFKDGDILNVHPDNLEWQPRWKRHTNPANYEIDLD